MSEQPLSHYQSNSARALILLHEQHLLMFLDTWKEAKSEEITLPATDNKHYASLDTLLSHTLDCARSYMIWICEQLQLPDPQINPIPPLDQVAEQAQAYLSHLFERWRLPLAAIENNQLRTPNYPTKWGTALPIEGMLEHAVMHPIRHEFQLRNLLYSQAEG